jgi:hypothetical protein
MPSRRSRKGPEGDPYDSDMGFSTRVWTVPTWLLLGCIGRNYPLHPTEDQKQDYETFLLSLGKVLPCGACRENFSNNLAAAGWDPKKDLADRQSFSRFINNLHNTVNRMLGKRINVSYEQHRDTFEAFRAKCTSATEHEGGCHGDRGPNDPRPSCIIQIIPEQDAVAVRRRYGNQSMIISHKCY